MSGLRGNQTLVTDGRNWLDGVFEPTFGAYSGAARQLNPSHVSGQVSALLMSDSDGRNIRNSRSCTEAVFPAALAIPIDGPTAVMSGPESAGNAGKLTARVKTRSPTIRET